MKKFRVTGDNLYGANGKIARDTVIEVEEIPESWEASVTEIGETVSPDAAEIVTGDAPNDDRLQLFRVAVDQLKVEDFKADGSPKTEPLNAALPEGTEPFTAEERDAMVKALAS